jgi:hypothetical protein
LIFSFINYLEEPAATGPTGAGAEQQKPSDLLNFFSTFIDNPVFTFYLSFLLSFLFTYLLKAAGGERDDLSAINVEQSTRWKSVSQLQHFQLYPKQVLFHSFFLFLQSNYTLLISV